MLNAALSRIQIKDTILNVLIYFLGHLEKGVLDVIACLGARLEKEQSGVVSELLRLLVGDVALRFEIGLVANEKYHRIGIGQIPSVGQPAIEVIVRAPTSDVVHQQRAGRASIV